MIALREITSINVMANNCMYEYGNESYLKARGYEEGIFIVFFFLVKCSKLSKRIDDQGKKRNRTIKRTKGITRLAAIYIDVCVCVFGD